MKKETAGVKMDNARTEEQLRRMEQLQEDGRCFFCDENYLFVGASPPIFDSEYWYVKPNDFPYEGSVHHHLIVCKRHFSELTDITADIWSDLLRTIEWLKEHTEADGYSVFVRSGDMCFTGSSLDHLHFHFLVGGPKKENSKIEDGILVTLGYKK